MIARRAVLLGAGAAVSTRANEAVTVGVVGIGTRGGYVGALVGRHTPARVVALCDVVPERIEAAKKSMGVENPRTYDDIRKLLASDVDAVIIATPVYLHAEHFELAVQSGKHIYMEKPASLDVAGCKRIMRAADAAGRKANITFGFQRRYGQMYLKAKAAVDAGAIGKIHLAFVRFIKASSEGRLGERLPEPRTEAERVARWTYFQKLSGDLIVENNVHVIDVMNWFLGRRPVSAIGMGGAARPQRGDMRDHNLVAYDYGDGLHGQLVGTTAASPGYRDVVEQFFGPAGTIETSETHWRHFRGAKDETFEKSARNPSIDSVAAFIERIRTGKPENVGVRAAESTLTAILGRMAMESRREVTWDEMMRTG